VSCSDLCLKNILKNINIYFNSGNCTINFFVAIVEFNPLYVLKLISTFMPVNLSVNFINGILVFSMTSICETKFFLTNSSDNFDMIIKISSSTFTNTISISLPSNYNPVAELPKISIDE